ncbi:Uncharacterized protein conserved in bacteria [Corynebacterium striatum]|uniref:hypothetical protein n=1 Tax=Corynebacterium striatum TaxID=43770 RepID=UPI000E012637|nr:hypothetical protein [Corynebacterium striatum]STC90405.1 Uncharacterized protein conserved in bacteria [Corynebacterium striatum]
MIQKLLHGFAATLLVPEAARDTINQWVNSRNVGTRLEYRTIPEFASPQASARSPRQLIHKLEFQDHAMRTGFANIFRAASTTSVWTRLRNWTMSPPPRR